MLFHELLYFGKYFASKSSLLFGTGVCSLRNISTKPLRYTELVVQFFGFQPQYTSNGRRSIHVFQFESSVIIPHSQVA